MKKFRLLSPGFDFIQEKQFPIDQASHVLDNAQICMINTGGGNLQICRSQV